MIRAKNYKTVTKSVKVMPRILWPLFRGQGVYIPCSKFPMKYTCQKLLKLANSGVICRKNKHAYFFAHAVGLLLLYHCYYVV